MDRLSRALSVGHNSSSNDKCSKNKQIVIYSKIEKSLDDWKLPPSKARVFKPSSIFNFSPEARVKTVEKEIPLCEGYASFPLFSDYLQKVYVKQSLLLQIGIVQVGLKPTCLGSNASAIVCLRDRSRLKFHESLLAMVESSLTNGPIYFSYVPSHSIRLSDPRLSSAFTIDIKSEGLSAVPGVGSITLVYRFHYKLMECSRPSKRKLWRSPIDGKGETTLFHANVGGSNGVVSKKIYWDQVPVPEKWMKEETNSPLPSPPHSPSPSSSTAVAEQGAVARIDWKEGAEDYALKVHVPGFQREEVNVEVEADRTLMISGERREELEKTGKGKWQCMERNSGKFIRRMTLPEDANLDELTAAMDNGVLTVTVPIQVVTQKRQPKPIHVSAAFN